MAEAEHQLNYAISLEYQNRNIKAEVIKQKFEHITREFNEQNKHFRERHEQIKNGEKARREEI